MTKKGRKKLVCFLCNKTKETYSKKYCSRECYHKSTIGKTTSLKGKTLDDIHGKIKAKYIKKKISKSMVIIKKQHWADPTSNYHSIQRSEKIKKARAKQIIPIYDTSIELKMQNLLTNMNICYQKQKYINDIKTKYRCDIFIKPNIVIECDGEYWHNYPHGTKRDIQITKELKENGYKVLRFWGEEINKNINFCSKKIVEVIQ